MAADPDKERYRDGLYLVRLVERDDQGNQIPPMFKPVCGPFPDIPSARAALEEVRTKDATLWLVRYVSVKDD
jgi:hypothetical protein